MSSSVHSGRLAFALAGTRWPDVTFPRLVLDGTQLVGEMPHFGIYRNAHVIADETPESLLSTSEAWIDEVLSRPPPRDPDDATSIWEKTLSEIIKRVTKSRLSFWQ